MNQPRREISNGTVIDLSSETIGIRAVDGTACLMEHVEGPPRRIAGLMVGAPMLTGDSPHGGERHPDGDEILFMATGCIDVQLELDGGDRTVRVGPGEAVVVPKGVWHLIHLVEPGRLIHVTPGPHGDHRPLPGPD